MEKCRSAIPEKQRKQPCQKICFTIPLEVACLAAMRFALGREVEDATRYEKYQSLATAVRTPRLMDRWLETRKRYVAADVKRVYYLSLEFLHGQGPPKCPC